ncbi:hypothetical protein EAE69_07500 [Hafnia alvei ATCC 13337]|nr:hypothetical protein XK86_06635 [Hafnia alvei]RLR11393.1 hypothetical protein EAE69_07500 [Hafnia alvei ATCC 13337]
MTWPNPISNKTNKENLNAASYEQASFINKFFNLKVTQSLPPITFYAATGCNSNPFACASADRTEKYPFKL